MPKTAIHYLKELSILGVGEFETDVEPHRFYLADNLKGLLEATSHTPPKLVTPIDPSTCDLTDSLSIENHLPQGVTQNDGVCLLSEGENLNLGGPLENF
jgi:hypothetical protein